MTSSPADLFASGEIGAWYEFSAGNTFTDTGGATAAASGDAIARITDLSNNGHDIVEGTSSNRPILRQTGALEYAEFNGSSHKLALPTSLDFGTSAVTIAVAIRLDQLDPVFSIVFTPGNPVINGGRFGLSVRPDGDWSVPITGASVEYETGGSIGVDYVIRLAHPGGGGTVDLTSLFVNGVEQVGVASGTQTLDIQPGGEIFGNALRNLGGRLVAAVAVGRLLTATETANLDAYLADLSGATIEGAGETGSGGSTSPAQTASGAGTRATDATGAGAVAAQTGSGTGLRIIPGTGGSTSPAQTSSGVILRTVTGTGAGTAPAQTGAGSVQPGSDATGGSTAPGQIASGAGLRAISATGGGTAPIQTATGVALRVITGGGAGASPAQTGAGVALRIGDSAGASIAPAQVGSGTGLREIVASGASTAPAQTGRGFNVLALPVPAWRTATVLAQDRSATVAAQDRSAAVVAQDRSAIVTRPAA